METASGPKAKSGGGVDDFSDPVTWNRYLANKDLGSGTYNDVRCYNLCRYIILKQVYLSLIRWSGKTIYTGSKIVLHERAAYLQFQPPTYPHASAS